MTDLLKLNNRTGPAMYEQQVDGIRLARFAVDEVYGNVPLVLNTRYFELHHACQPSLPEAFYARPKLTL